LLDYVSGFSKINNRERFEIDIWEGEKQFDRIYRPSTTATRSRIAYLYPKPPDETVLVRYLESFSALIALARQNAARVAIVKLPVPAQFRSQLPREAAFDGAITRLLEAQNLVLRDFSQALNEPRFYFDTDHLNRSGLTEFFRRDLKSVLAVR